MKLGIAFLWTTTFLLAGALYTCITVAIPQHEATAYANGLSDGRIIEADYENGVMHKVGLCSYATLACVQPKERKKHGAPHR